MPQVKRVAENERLVQRLVAQALICEARQLIAELADGNPLSFIQGYKFQTMLEADLIAHHSLDMHGRVGRHNKLQRDNASDWHFLCKERAQTAFRDLVAVPFDFSLMESDLDR